MIHFGLIGNPLTHSFSEKYFSEKFQKEKLSGYSYKLFSIPKIELLPELLEKQTLSGFNVTIPYKESVIPFLHELSEEAKLIGAVNCVKLVDDKWIGHNTDAFGFGESLQKWLSPNVKSAIILGNGGSAKAVKFALKQLGISFKVVSRSGDLNYENLPASLVHETKLMINTTPLGMSPKMDEFPEIPFEAITSSHFVFDLIYNPEETLFLRKCRLAGANTKNGSEMLKLQADKSWEIWTS